MNQLNPQNKPHPKLAKYVDQVRQRPADFVTVAGDGTVGFAAVEVLWH